VGSCLNTSNNIRDIATKLGWSADVSSGDGTPQSFQQLFSTALSKHVDAIVAVAVPGIFVQQQLAQAEQQGVVTIAVNGSTAERPGTPVMSTHGTATPYRIDVLRQGSAEELLKALRSPVSTGNIRRPAQFGRDIADVVRGVQTRPHRRASDDRDGVLLTRCQRTGRRPPKLVTPFMLASSSEDAPFRSHQTAVRRGHHPLESALEDDSAALPLGAADPPPPPLPLPLLHEASSRHDAAAAATPARLRQRCGNM